MPGEVIFTTVHGSHLYGFAHAGSDVDAFAVTTDRDRGLRQTVDGIDDRVVVGIDRFLRLAHDGSHQSVEALFSPVKVWNPSPTAARWRPLLEATVIGGGDVYSRYTRTIRRFCYGDFKRRRHAVRLTRDLELLRAYGRFNPRLSAAEVEHASEIAARLEGDDLVLRLLA